MPPNMSNVDRKKVSSSYLNSVPQDRRQERRIDIQEWKNDIATLMKKYNHKIQFWSETKNGDKTTKSEMEQQSDYRLRWFW